MALNAYLRLTGETQGQIKGSVAQAGREDSIEVNAFSHSIAAPADKKNSQSPITITMDVDKATPGLHRALVNNELLTDWSLQFWRPSPTGEEVQFYTVALLGGRVSSIESEMLNNRYPENQQLREREHVSFTYQKIVWTWEDGGLTAEADAEF